MVKKLDRFFQKAQIIIILIIFSSLYAQETPSNPSVYLYNLGVKQFSASNYDSALVLFQKSIELDSSFARGYIGIGNITYIMGKIWNAEEYYLRAIACDTTIAETFINLGKIYNEAGDYPTSLSYLKKGLGISPHNPSALLLAGMDYFFLEEDSAAESYYKKALQISPHLVDGWISLGLLYRVQGRLDEAEAVYRKAIVQKGNLAIAHYGLSCVLVKLGENKKGLKELKMALELDPNLVETFDKDRCFKTVKEEKAFKKLLRKRKED